MLVVVYAKILKHSFIPTIYENVKLVYYLSRTSENLETSMSAWFGKLQELKEFFGRFTGF